MRFATQHIHAKSSQRSRGILGVAFALVLGCALGAMPAYAEVLPEGSGSFDVSVLTDVLPTVDPAAVFGKATVQTVDQTGAALGGVQVEVSVVPANNNGQPFGDAVLGSTGPDGRVVLQQVAVKGAYQVVASKQGYQPTTCTFACRGASEEVWEVRLAPEPRDNPANSGGAGNPGNAGNAGNPGNAKKLDTFGNLASTDGTSSAAGVGPSAPADANPGDSAARSSSSQTMQTDSFFAGNGWVLAAVLLAAAVVVIVLVLFARKKKQGDQQ